MTKNNTPLTELQVAVAEQNKEKRRDELPAVLPDEFWDARPYLKHIQQAAFNRTASPDAYLGCVLARVAASTSAGFRLPATVGNVSGLQTYVALIGNSGLGKSSSFGSSGDLINWPSTLGVVPTIPAGTGEGIIEAFFGMVDGPEDENGKKGPKTKQQVRHNLLAYADEGEAIMNRTERGSDIFFPTIKSMWTGGLAGQHNATAERQRTLTPGSYAFGFVILFQPEVVGAMLADVGTGTPQRFLCVAATHPDIPTETPEWPGPLEQPNIPNNITAAHLRYDHNNTPYTQFGLTDEIVAQIKTEHHKAAIGETPTDKMDSHRRLLQLKIAALLAYLDSRLDVSNEDWALANQIVNTSRSVRSWAQKQVQAITEHKNRASARMRAAQDEETDKFRTVEVAKRIATVVHENKSITKREILNFKLSKGQKDYFGPALESAVKAGYVEIDDATLTPGEKKP